MGAGHTGVDDAAFRDALGRLYGFGERLRWSQAVTDLSNFMFLDRGRLPVTPWLTMTSRTSPSSSTARQR